MIENKRVSAEVGTLFSYAAGQVFENNIQKFTSIILIDLSIIIW